jgi:hypothetical protein
MLPGYMESLIRACLCLVALVALATPAYAAEVILSGPTASIHSSHGYRWFHPGAGVAVQAQHGHIVHGPWFHWMSSDSYGDPSWWAVYTVARRFGDRQGFIDAGVGVGLLQKDNYRDDPFPVALPYLEAGKGRLSVLASVKPPLGSRPVWALFGIIRIKLTEF